ncbi:GNAT family N-acetyltransferase [Peribacillus cavernae]|uniref:GNAT family N-acetyltransferase n=1 Tax=Peribacillus cavernae TaxID=1674310 RepID=A0A433HK82_9BACI|nr:GNAT family N-acetyltransferase [Peribacillus cavernae]MDQ0220215.1 GNAT superfamily N-acetyltransferase [Peribacillus cavernae]RUQ28834.1 GNAT family N-acetyltransferase [Peribacillus cavernae]
MLDVRCLEVSETDFLMDMMFESIYIPENKPSKKELLNLPHLKKYNEGWGRIGDRALIALNEDNHPVGAVWYRLFDENNKGYGYIDTNTPELGIAVLKEARGMGAGTLLMRKIIEKASDDGYKSISLSVDPNNIHAVQLYNKLRFEKCGSSGTSWTMVYFISASK